MKLYKCTSLYGPIFFLEGGVRRKDEQAPLYNSALFRFCRKYPSRESRTFFATRVPTRLLRGVTRFLSALLLVDCRGQSFTVKMLSLPYIGAKSCLQVGLLPVSLSAFHSHLDHDDLSARCYYWSRDRGCESCRRVGLSRMEKHHGC